MVVGRAYRHQVPYYAPYAISLRSLRYLSTLLTLSPYAPYAISLRSIGYLPTHVLAPYAISLRAYYAMPDTGTKKAYMGVA
eukprot:355741-Rhodomonas_salina.3